MRVNSTWLTGFHFGSCRANVVLRDCQSFGERFLGTLLTEKWENVSVLFGDLNKRKEALQAFSFLNKKKREEMVCIEETSNREKPVKAKDLLEIGLRDVGSIYWNCNPYNSKGASNPKSDGNVGNPTLFPKRIIRRGLQRLNKVHVTLKSPRTIAPRKIVVEHLNLEDGIRTCLSNCLSCQTSVIETSLWDKVLKETGKSRRLRSNICYLLRHKQAH
ncbi:hypothetical protein NPIL_41801 [Nephila pilipes]|uniref:Uncharacterized protein n=1 Tax=Nephila pilipes TaxID=299642 RepID=A0A8X6TJK8_NEPPI|nr:hypothetical protein NPIL_41801 [Nephila pilipes]